MSDPMRPHRQQRTRLPCPQDSLGENTGVGCHFLLHKHFILTLNPKVSFTTSLTHKYQVNLYKIQLTVINSGPWNPGPIYNSFTQSNGSNTLANLCARCWGYLEQTRVPLLKQRQTRTIIWSSSTDPWIIMSNSSVCLCCYMVGSQKSKWHLIKLCAPSMYLDHGK